MKTIALVVFVFRLSMALQAQTPLVLKIPVEGMIHPIASEFIGAGIDRAASKGAALVLIQLNTPGGLDTSMREIIEKIIASPAPVAVYVSPSGNRAASAGFFILLSADVAAMASGTNTGAAHPVFMGGGQVDEVMKQKVENDAAAYLRSIASKRHRNASVAETGVTQSKSFTESEALKENLIDLVAANEAELLKKLDGFETTRFDGRKQTLRLAGAAVEVYAPSSRQMFLSRILDPNIAFILLILGLLGLYVELTHPGLILPGVGGGIALVVSLFAMSLLPINWVGAALLFLAIIFFVLEAKFATHGILAAGGILSMILGALMLIKAPLPGGSVTLPTALSVTIPFALITMFLLRLVLRSRRLKVATGTSGLIGEIGSVHSADAGNGTIKVYVHGELWDAISQGPVSAGIKIQVTSVDGMILRVTPVPEPGPSQ